MKKISLNWRICMETFLSICSEIVLKLLNKQTILLFCFGIAFNTYLKSCKQGILQITSLARSIDGNQSLHLKGHKLSIVLCSWEFLCVRDAGRRGNKITASKGFTMLRNVPNVVCHVKISYKIMHCVMVFNITRNYGEVFSTF